MLGTTPKQRAGRQDRFRTSAAQLLEWRNLRSAKRVGAVLMYHEVAPGSGDPLRDLVPRLDAQLFQSQLAYLQHRYRTVPLIELHASISARRVGEPIPVSLTFDDDLPSHSRYVVPILKEAGASGTFFLTGASLRGERSFWWQDLQAVGNRGGEIWREIVRDLGGEGGIRSVAQTIEAMRPEERDRVGERIRTVAGSAPANSQMSRGEIEQIARSGFEIGFHTLRHYNLQTVSSEQLDKALTDGLDEIKKVTGQRPTSIAYPHCRADLRIAQAARASGFKLGCVCDGRAVTATADPLLMDRINGWSVSLGHFALRLARALRVAAR